MEKISIRTRPGLDLLPAYHAINSNVTDVLRLISSYHVGEYRWLLDNRNNATDPEYQKRYKKYWGMQRAGFSDEYCQEYFRYLWDERFADMEVKVLAYTLYETPVKNDVQKVQFSFCTKLCHTQNQQLPIYDSTVREFYGFKLPYNTSPYRRIDRLVAFYHFLIDEYRRVLDEKLLSHAITTFRNRFNADCFSDVKVIDSLIWTYKRKHTQSSV